MLPLTRREYQLITILALAAPEPVPTYVISRALWGETGKPGHVTRLVHIVRKKVGQGAIENTRRGYRWRGGGGIWTCPTCGRELPS